MTKELSAATSEWRTEKPPVDERILADFDGMIMVVWRNFPSDKWWYDGFNFIVGKPKRWARINT